MPPMTKQVSLLTLATAKIQNKNTWKFVEIMEQTLILADDYKII